MTWTTGYIYAATGDLYLTLARRSARRLKSVMPEVTVDLFTDRDLSDPVFDRIHRLKGAGRRPKMEALRRSRFDRTLYLDADTVVVRPIADALDLLDRFDVVGAHENYRNSPSSRTHWKGRIPSAFPEINSGVLGIRKSRATRTLLRRWEEGFLTSDLKNDQPVLRRLLYDSRLRVGVLPMDYNLMHTRALGAMGRKMAAPRVLHVTRLHAEGADPGDPMISLDPADCLAPAAHQALLALIEGDLTEDLEQPAAARRRPEPDRPTLYRRSASMRLLAALSRRFGFPARRS